MRFPRTHAADCFCVTCKARRRAHRQIEIAEGLARAAAKSSVIVTPDAAVNSRRAKRRAAAEIVGAAEIARTDRLAADLAKKREAAATDRQAARMLELIAEGRTLDDAIATVEAELMQEVKTDDGQGPGPDDGRSDDDDP